MFLRADLSDPITVWVFSNFCFPGIKQVPYFLCLMAALSPVRPFSQETAAHLKAVCVSRELHPSLQAHQQQRWFSLPVPRVI